MSEMLPAEYLYVKGPEGLKAGLNQIFEASQHDPNKEYYMSYQLKDQKSLIKIDMKQKPWLFFFFDLSGRPAPHIIKKTIGDFLLEHEYSHEHHATVSEEQYAKLTQKHIMDLSRIEAHNANPGFKAGIAPFTSTLKQYSYQDAADILDKINRASFILRQQPDLVVSESEAQLSKFGIFGNKAIPDGRPITNDVASQHIRKKQ